MQNYYIPHKLKEGDITHLADNDSLFAINDGLREEDIINIQAPNGIFQAIVTFIEKKSIEVQILKLLSELKSEYSGITIIQGISNSSKFGLFLEKITEIGIDNIIPIQSDLCLIDTIKFNKEVGLYEKIIKDACEQSRNPSTPNLEKAIQLKNLKQNILGANSLKLCFITENITSQNLKLLKVEKRDSIIMAFGPESGWSLDDINIFKKLGFKFIKLKGNILRTETTPIVVTSIIKFIQNKL